jgi:GAF domain-containing protein
MSTDISGHDDFLRADPLLPAESAGIAPTVCTAAQTYAVLGFLVHADQSMTELLTQVAELAQQVIPGAEDISITVIDQGKPRSVAFTGTLAAMLDERQYEDGYGPCVEAARTGQVIEIGDTAHDTTYPHFSRLAARQGVQRTLSIGMPTRSPFSAGMNIYVRAASGPFSQETRDVAMAFASYAAIVILNATLYNARREEVEQFRTAMASRAQIEQAKGIIMGDRGCTADEAFDLLSQESGHAHRKLRDIARTIIEDVGNGRSLTGS